MSNQPNRDSLYKAAGEALHAGQVLEVNVRTLIALLNAQMKAGLDADQIILSDDKRTLGRLIENLKPLAQFCSDTESAMSAALSARNYIAHDFFVRHTDAFLRDDLMQVALARLDKLEKEILAATAITSGFVQGICQAFNVKPNDVFIRQDI